MLRRIAASAALIAFAGCSGSASSFDSPGGVATTTPIKHVVFIIQENRSFNNLFLGYPGATTQRYGFDQGHRKIALRRQSLSTGWDLSHSAATFFAQCDGRGRLPGTDCKMDGWNEGLERDDPANAPYAYVPENEVGPYWEMAREYVLADRNFSSNLDGSFIAHQYSVAAFAAHGVDWPSGATWGCEGGRGDTLPTILANRTFGRRIPACFDYPTIAAEADEAGLTWRFYASGIYDDGGTWSSYQAVRDIFYGPDWSTNVISPATKFMKDVANGSLANVTWITPTWENSDHPGLFGSGGPRWVASLVNAIGASKFWDSTAIFITWDDWGGWFDPVPPVHEDYDGLGFRVPLLIVSPYAKRGYVTHVQYETSSVLRFIEDNFGLSRLARSDARANDPAGDAFDYSQRARPFKKIRAAPLPRYSPERSTFAPADPKDGD